MKNKRLLLRDACRAYPLSLLMRLLSKWLKPWTSKEIYQGKLINLRVQIMPQPSGGTTRFEIVEHPGGVAIVALRYEPMDGHSKEPHVMLVYQQRPAIGKYLWEIPAGMVEENERDTPKLTAARELREETGYVADTDSLQCLVREYPSPGFSNETITIYLAKQVHSASDAPADPTEITKIRWIPLSKALASCLDGEIQDGKTVLGLFLAHYNITNGISMPERRDGTPV